MKRLFLMLCTCAAVAVACTSEVTETPAVSFETAFPVTAGEVATFTIAVADYSGIDAVAIPVTFGGTAVKGTDYSVSAEEFVVGGANPVTSIQVTTLVFDESKTVSLTLNIPDGWKAGNYPMSETTLSKKLGYVSFEKASLGLTGSAEIQVSVFDGNGSPLTLENDAVLNIAVSEESTAEETTHFTLSTKAVTIPAGSNSAKFTVAMVGDEAVEEHDQILLTLDPGSKFSIGNYDEIAIAIWGSAWAKLNGKWTMNEIVTTSENLNESWWDMCTYDGLPEFNAADAITFDVAAGKAIPEFTSTYKNYFIGESNLVKGDNLYMRTGMSSGIDLLLIEFDNINRFFSATDVSEDKKALVGVRIITDEETNEELLDMYIVDHTSKSFMPELLDYAMYDSVKPVATMTGCWLNATFKKVK